MAESSMSAPVGFGGGITRYKEEYNSKFKFGPGAVVAMILAVIVFVIGLNVFYK